MQTKLIEIRDRKTYVPVMAVGFYGRDSWMLRRSGYGHDKFYVILTKISGKTHCEYSPCNWGDRTMSTAHKYLVENWPLVGDGGMIDVEVVKGEKEHPTESEQGLRLVK